MVNKGLVHVKTKDGMKITITKDEYKNNKDKYTNYLKTSISAKTKDGKFVSITHKEFNKGDYVGVNKGIKQELIECYLCHAKIGSSNIDRHIKAHSKNYYYITDYKKQNTIKVIQKDFYEKYSNTHYIEKRRGHYTKAYLNGEEITIKKLIQRKKK